MTKRKFASRVKYLRALYAEMGEIEKSTTKHNLKIRSGMAKDHLMCAVALLFDVFEMQDKN